MMIFEIIGLLLVSWLLADLLSGIFHWMEDRYFKEEWPLIGKHIAIPNQIHHERPNDFLNQNYFSRNSTTILPALLIFIVAYLCGAPLFILLALIFTSQANEIHAFSHQKCNWLIKMLQDTNIFQGPKGHAIHHKAPFDCSYCVMSGFLNPLLDTFKVWYYIELVIEKCTGIKPKNNTDNK